MPWLLTAVLLTPLGLLAQSVGSNDATEIVTLVTQVGLSAIFFWQWRHAESKYSAGQVTLLNFAERAVAALQASTDTLSKVQDSMAVQYNKVVEAVPDKRDSDMLMRRMEFAIDELRLQLKDQTRERNARDREGGR